MKLFIDTANIDQIREIHEWGVLAGVTTNPTLIGKEGVDIRARIREICEIVPGPVSAEVVAPDADGMVSEGKELAQLAPNVYVKLPFGPAGLTACSRLTELGIRVNMTLVFSANQAILAAHAGAAFVSAFIGRVDDTSTDGIAVLSEIIDIFEIHGYDAEVLAASLRHPRHVVDAAKAGADIATLPHSVFQAMLPHPLTELGTTRFLADWDALQEKLKQTG